MNEPPIMVSACVIVYNHEKYLRECLESVVNQNMNFSYEVVIGDDCSTDKSLTICREYEKNYPHLVRLIERPNNLGMAGNWVETIAECKGGYIAICEGDDFWIDNKKLQKQFDFMSTNFEFSACFGKGKVLNMMGEKHDFNYPTPPRRELKLCDILSMHYIPTATLFYRKEMLADISQYIYSVRSVDIFIETLLCMRGPIGFLDNMFAVYRIHTGGITKSDNAAEIGDRKLTEMYIYFYNNTSGESKKLFRYRIARRYLFKIHQLRNASYIQGMKDLLMYAIPILKYFRNLQLLKSLLITLFFQVFPFINKRT